MVFLDASQNIHHQGLSVQFFCEIEPHFLEKFSDFPLKFCFSDNFSKPT